MTQLLAFHGDPAIKAKYLARVDGHIKADNLIRGTGWNGFRGCAVGCTLEAYDHDRYPVELGVPVWLAHVEDRLFEGMSEEKAHTWPRDFLDAMKPGVDLEKIKGPFLIIILESALKTFNHEKFPKVKDAIDGSIALWRRADIGSDDWQAPPPPPPAAAEAARAAAAQAAWGAVAAAAAAWADKYDYFADELLRLLKSAE